MKFHRIDFKILRTLKDNNDAFTIAEIGEKLKDIGEKSSRSTIYRHLHTLVKAGLVSIGAMVDHAESFYISPQGKLFLDTGIL